MTVAGLTIRWFAIEAARERATLAAILGVDIPDRGPVDIPGLRLEIVAPGTGRTRGRLDVAGTAPGAPTILLAPPSAETAVEAGVVGAAEPDTDEVAVGLALERFAGPTRQAPSSARFLALGWATVDLERAAARWPGVRWRTAPRDSLVGARALVGRTGTPVEPASAERVAGDGTTLVLLEPDAEGRLAAALARHGEGPAALYVLVPRDAIRAIEPRVARLGVRFIAGSGPFGSAWATAGLDASGPTVIVLPGAVPDD